MEPYVIMELLELLVQVEVVGLVEALEELLMY
jgi:hypothetical protein